MVKFSQYDMEERDVSQNENREFFLKNSFRNDTFYDKTTKPWNHGLIANNKSCLIYQYSVSSLLDNFNFSEIIPFRYDLVAHGKVTISAYQYDFLKEHVDLRVLSSCIKIKKLLVPFYGKMFGLQYLQSVLFDAHIIDTFYFVWCSSCTLSILDIYKHHRNRDSFNMLSENYFDAGVKLVLRECFNKNLDEDEAIQKIFSALSSIMENWKADLEIGRMGATSMTNPNFLIQSSMESDVEIWTPSGMSNILHLVRDENKNCKYYLDNDNKTIKEISFENLMSETTGKINLDAYYVLAKTPVSEEETLTFEECMDELWIKRGK